MIILPGFTGGWAGVVARSAHTDAGLQKDRQGKDSTRDGGDDHGYWVFILIMVVSSGGGVKDCIH